MTDSPQPQAHSRGHAHTGHLCAWVARNVRPGSTISVTVSGTPSHQAISLLVDALALLLPALDRFAQSAWLVDSAASWQVLGANAVQALLYIVLLGAAAMSDFYRRNL